MLKNTTRDENDHTDSQHDRGKQYIKQRKKLTGLFFETALPNEYLVQMGKKTIKPVLGGKKIRLFRKFLRVPASVQTLYFVTDNANNDYQGIGVEGYASWRIDPKRPTVSITTLDFFDENDPIRDTNNKLKTICIEAVRHVISNMSIDDALKKKEEIAQKLKEQLLKIEERWGIIFDQVGIEKVRIMSNNLFEELQAQFRDKLRLDVSKTRINTDREISKEENTIREKNELERLETDKKISLADIEKNSHVKEVEIDGKQKITEKERDITEGNYRRDIQFKMEQEQKEFELTNLKKDLDIKMQTVEKNYLDTQKAIEEIKNQIAAKQLEIEKLQKEISQIFSQEALTNKFIETLPLIYESLHIDNYSVLASGSEGSISPVSKLLQELIFSLKSSELGWLLKEKKTGLQKFDDSKE